MTETSEQPENRSNTGASANTGSPTVEVPTATPVGLPSAVTLRLTVREQETFEELTRLDQHLAGLYRIGLELMSRVSEPGVAYVLAHVGRELGNGVVRLLCDEMPALADTESEKALKEESHKAHIGTMLGVPPTHASVTIWSHTQRIFVSATHYRPLAPAADQVRDAFQRLSGLLFGRVAPYFSTHAALEELLAIGSPTPEHVTQARELLLRPIQRHHFFGKLEHDAWLAPLAGAGYFRAPDLAVDSQGVEHSRPWPEGEFLVRVAVGKPDQVVQLLLAIPDANRNTVVWDSVARVALALPVSQSRRLVRQLVNATSNLPDGALLSNRLIDLTRAIAEGGQAESFELAECLLWLTGGPSPRHMTEAATPKEVKTSDDENAQDDTASVSASVARSLSRGSRDTEWMFPRLSGYALSQFIQKALPALEALDAERLLKLLALKLERAIRLGQSSAELQESSMLQRGEARSRDRAANAESKQGHDAYRRDDSQYWADRLDQVDEADDVRTQLAFALTNVASRTAARDVSGAHFVDDILARGATDVFTRIRLVALTTASEHAPQSSLDALVGDSTLVDPPFRAREVAAFLREQFESASIDARRLFVSNLERGPNTEVVDRIAAFRAQTRESVGTNPTAVGQDVVVREDTTARTDVEAREFITSWKRTRLRWFHDQIPDLLQPMAAALGVRPNIPSAEEQALDEVGHWSSGVFTGGYVSPTSVDALAGMSPEAIVDLLRTWKPKNDGAPFQRASSEGLQQSLTSFVKEHRDVAAALAQLLTADGIAPGYLGAVLAGFESIADRRELIPWRQAIALLEFVLSAADHAFSAVGQDSADDRGWRGALSSGVDMLRTVCAQNMVPGGSIEDAWRVATRVIQSPVTWSEAPTSANIQHADVESLGDLELAAVNSLQGRALRMLMEVALYDYRRLESPEASVTDKAGRRSAQPAEALGDASGTASRLVPLLESSLTQAGRPGRLARTTLGDFVPQLMLLARRWVLEHADALFTGGAESPNEFPTWGAYLARGGFYDLVFRDLRVWYVRAAAAAPDPTAASLSSEWSVSRNLAEHTMVAVVRGAASVGDEDQLVEGVFARVRVEDRARAFWSIYRGWSDARNPVPTAFVGRLVRFWEWRVSVLETQGQSEEGTGEAEGLVWFLVTPYIPSADAIRLGLRTLRLTGATWRKGSTAWERVGELAQDDAAGAFELAEFLARRALTTQFPYLPYPQVAPCLRAALSGGDADTRSRARRLVNELGEHGFLEFGGLLDDK